MIDYTDSTMPFGKHKGKKLTSLKTGSLLWYVDNISGDNMLWLRQHCKQIVDDREGNRVDDTTIIEVIPESFTGVKTKADAICKNADEALSIWGYKSFRNNQKEIIEHILSGDSSETVAVMPTGAGKSILFQVSALVCEGLTLVVSPLIALMVDQVNSLKKLGIEAECIHGDMSVSEKREALSRVDEGTCKILYCSPERLSNRAFLDFLNEIHISILAIDEAHCISQWGHDFRPSFKRIVDCVKIFKPERIIALTATATKKVREDISETLLLSDKVKTFVTGFYRNDLEVYASKNPYSPSMKSYAETILKTLRDTMDNDGGGSGIVYTITKKDAEAIASHLRKTLPDNVWVYHSTVNKKEKSKVLDEWFAKGGIVVGTSAFGMGIDKADVRFVVNIGLPSSVEEWYQMVGRGSRDGKGAKCVTIWTPKDLHIREFLVSMSYPEYEDLIKVRDWFATQYNKGKTMINKTQKGIGDSAGVSASIGGGCVSVLVRLNMISKIKNGQYKILSDTADIKYSEYNEKRSEKVNNFLRVRNLLENKTTCRMRQFCDYFGEDIENDCGICDNCI